MSTSTALSSAGDPGGAGRLHSGNKKPLEDLMRAWRASSDSPRDPEVVLRAGGLSREDIAARAGEEIVLLGRELQPRQYPVSHLAPNTICGHRTTTWEHSGVRRQTCFCNAPFGTRPSQELRHQGDSLSVLGPRRTSCLDGPDDPKPLAVLRFRPKGRRGSSQSFPVPITQAKGYETVRYPCQGWSGSGHRATEAHTTKFPDFETNVRLLNDKHIVAWLNTDIIINGRGGRRSREGQIRCLPNASELHGVSNTTFRQPMVRRHEYLVVTWRARTTPSSRGRADSIWIMCSTASPIDGRQWNRAENGHRRFDTISSSIQASRSRVFWLWQKKRRVQRQARGHCGNIAAPIPRQISGRQRHGAQFRA